MSRQEQLDALSAERSTAEAQIQQNRDASEPVTQTPYTVLSQDLNSISFAYGLSGSLTSLSDGTSYLLAGEGIELTVESNGPVTITSTAISEIAGNDGEVQFNNSGELSGDSDFTFDDSTGTLTVTNVQSSLTRLTDGSSYINAGANVVILSGSDGSITVSQQHAVVPGSATTTAIISDERQRGSFDTLGLSNSTRKTLMGVPGTVSVIEPDGVGGAFIGGTFTSVQGVRRSRLAHIDSSGSVSSWNGTVTSTVNSLKLSGSTLFVGGQFNGAGHIVENTWSYNLNNAEIQKGFRLSADSYITRIIKIEDGSKIVIGSFRRILGQNRNNIAKINSDGTLNALWDPNANSVVYALALSGSTLYIGGAFTTVSGATRNRIAAVDIETGALLPFNPSSISTVFALALSGSTLYVGGAFTTVSGSARNNIAAVDATTGELLPFNPNANSIVNSFALSGSTLYMGGTFTTVSGSTRNRVAAVDATTGTLLSFDPNANSSVTTFALSGSTLYMGGGFSTVSGSTRNRVAAVDTTTGELLPFDPNASSTVNDIVLSGSTLYMGGLFTTLGGQTQLFMGAVDAETGTAITLGAGATNSSLSTRYVNLIDDTLYVSTISSWSAALHRFPQRIVAFNADYRQDHSSNLIDKQSILAFSADTDGTVTSLAVSGSTLYMGGVFTAVSGSTRNRVAAVDTTTGELLPFDPNANGSVNAFALSGSTLYMGGGFSAVSGSTRNRVAAVDATTGALLPFDPNANGSVTTFALSGSTLYMGGTFTTVSGSTRNRVAAVDTTTGELLPFDPNASSTVSTFALSGSTLYMGGFFTSINPKSMGRGLLYHNNEVFTDLYISGSNTISSVVLEDGSMIVGGNFTQVQGVTRNYVAKFNPNGTLNTSWNPNPNNTVSALTLSGSTLYMGGFFTSVSGSARNRVAAVNATTAALLPFNPNAGSTVSALALSGSTLYMGGSFLTMSGSTRNNIAAVDATTAALLPFNPNANNSVNEFALSGSTLYVGGSFTTMSGSTRNRVAAVDATTGALLPFNPNAGGTVYRFILTGSTLYIGGGFGTVSGSTRNNIAAVDATTAELLPFNPNANNTVRALALSGSTLYAGGIFTTISGSTRNYVAGVDTSTGNLTALGLGVLPVTGQIPVLELKMSGSSLFVGGNIASSSLQRNRIAAVDVTSGIATDFDPDVTAAVTTLHQGTFFGEECLIAGASATDGMTHLSSQPGFSLPASSSRTLRYFVHDNIMKLMFDYRSELGGTKPGVGNYIISLPSGFIIDTSVVPIGSVASYTSNFASGMAVGLGGVQGDFIGGGGSWAVVPINSRQLVLVGKDPASAETVTWGANGSPITSPDMKVYFTATIPVIEISI